MYNRLAEKEMNQGGLRRPVKTLFFHMTPSTYYQLVSTVNVSMFECLSNPNIIFLKLSATIW